jgi:succinylglutamic semialdehyde dehydrogenase
MGGKNPAIVAADADLDVAIHETLIGAFVTAGQRCSATSRILVARPLFEAFVDRFHERAKAFTIGHPLDSPFMGPLIEAGSVDRYLKFIGIAQREGCEVVMRGKQLEAGSPGHYVTPSICAVRDSSVEYARKSIYQQTELFAPNAAIVPFDDLDHAVALANVTQYGLVASVFTRDRATFVRAREELEFGLVNWNKSTVGASSRLPFGGFKKSGNHMPTALSSTLYCAAPVASLEVEQPRIAPATAYPGLNWA